MLSQSQIPPSIQAKLARLHRILHKMGKALVAFSGGVDSTLLLRVALDVLGDNVLAVIASSETYPEREVKEARKLGRRLGARVLVIKTREIDNPDFSKNPPQRCYYCKQELFSRLKEIAAERSIPHVLDGSNFDDRADFRPGSRAGKELGIRSPLREAGLTKDDIRLLSKDSGLPTWDKPSLACLASRFPYDTPIERRTLSQVGRAEDYLRQLGFSQVRVRHHGQVARIEVPAGDLARVASEEFRFRIARHFKSLGYTYVSLDLEGYRTGSMNEPLRHRKTKSRELLKRV